MPETVTVIATLRHARTQHGSERRYAGSMDVPLSDPGRDDCRRARPWLAHSRYDVILSSPQARALETARLVAPADSSIEIDPLIVERRYGVMEGRTWEEVQTIEPPILFIEVGGNRHSVNPWNGEPFEDIWRRAQQFSRRVLERHAGRRILVVSHSAFLQMLHGVLLGRNCIESLDSEVANLELSTFTLNGMSVVHTRSEHLATAPTRATF